MRFNCKFNKEKGPVAKLIFEFEAEKHTHVISYQFACLVDGKLAMNWAPHSFIKNVLGTIKHEWKEVDVLKTYFPEYTKPGKYSIEITIRYFVCDEEKERFVKDTAEIEID